MEQRGLGDLHGNPLTLTLLAKLAEGGRELPKSRASLLDHACELLAQEENQGHSLSPSAQCSIDDLRDSAGAVFAHLLLSGSTGVAEGRRSSIPVGFVSKTDLAGIPQAPAILEALKTRLFQSEAEGVFVPIHRVVAEFLGARWLSKRLAKGLSKRRVLQALVHADAVPTSLRGLHAWLAYFDPQIADHCIRRDPYGVLRYGDTGHLSVPHARLLLESLASLAEEDPYFRSEDWGQHAVAGFVRAELKNEVVELLKKPDRPVHLSTLILEALRGSDLTAAIISDLLTIVHDPSAAYAERINAADALMVGDAKIDWVSLVDALKEPHNSDSNRLRLDIIGRKRGEGFTGTQIADAILDYDPIFSDEERSSRVLGVTWTLTRKLSIPKSAEILDEIARRIEESTDSRRSISGELSTTIHYLISRSLEITPPPDASRLWSWMRPLIDQQGYDSDARRRIDEFLRASPALRHEIQNIAFHDHRVEGGPWMVVFDALPSLSGSLAVTAEDASIFLKQIASKDALNPIDVDLWVSLVRSQWSREGFADEIQSAARIGAQRHPELYRQWEMLTTPPARDWLAEAEKREARARKQQSRRFKGHRAAFLSKKDEIASGSDIGALSNMASAYLARYSDLSREGLPADRLREWLGNELTEVALSGFVAALSKNDLPTAQKITENHTDGKRFLIEDIIVCGVAELIRSGRPLTHLSLEVAKAALAAWWESAYFNNTVLGEDIGKQLEMIVLSSDEAIEEFLTTVMVPYIRSGHDHVPGLYELRRDDRFSRVAGALALRWLKAYPEAKTAVQFELLQAAIQHAPSEAVVTIIRERLSELSSVDSEMQQTWISAAFLMDFDASEDLVSAFCDASENHLWPLRDMVRPDLQEGQQWRPINSKSPSKKSGFMINEMTWSSVGA